MRNVLMLLLLGLTGCGGRERTTAGSGECVFQTDVDFCDSRDNDCDGEIDEDCLDEGEPGVTPPDEASCETDADCDDGDGCTADVCSIEGCVNVEQCAPDDEPGAEPCVPDADSDCDGDGVTVRDGDCDDLDAERSPLLIESNEAANLADGKDNDCDITADEWGGPDADQDMVPDATDCDPADPRRWTGAPELCGDGIDSDCNGDDDTDTWGSCFTVAGAIEGMRVASTLIQIVIAGDITSGLIEDPAGEITRVTIGMELYDWDETEDPVWASWQGEGILYTIPPFPNAGAFTPRLRTVEGVQYFDLRAWDTSGNVRRVPARTGRWGLVLITP